MSQSTSKGDISGNQGRLLYFHLNNHKSKIALFLDLTPELADAIRTAAPRETEVIHEFVEMLMPAWYLAAEERQIHYGENFVDLPDSMHGLFLAHSFLWQDPAERLRTFTDIPWCRADLFYFEKLVHTMEQTGRVPSLSADDAQHALIALVKESNDQVLTAGLDQLLNARARRIDDEWVPVGQDWVSVGKWKCNLTGRRFVLSLTSELSFVEYDGEFTWDPSGNWHATIRGQRHAHFKSEKQVSGA